ncbi:MAG: hypothetical protein ACJAQ6_001302 [Arenicella sp.]|jgi:hypothetical protein
MKKILIGFVAVALGLVIGLGSLRYIVTTVSGEIRNGPWITDFTAGGTDAGAYTRAKLAAQALLAMTKDQSVYFIAETDSAGDTLDAACHYTLSGGDLPTRWWSITIYASDYFFVANQEKRYAISKSSLSAQTDENGQWNASINNTATANLISPKAGSFSLMVRHYHPEPIVSEDPYSLKLPVITKGECR